jgi:hypothetical protein
MEEIGLADLAGGLDAQTHVPGHGHAVTLGDEFLSVHRLGRQMTLQSGFCPAAKAFVPIPCSRCGDYGRPGVDKRELWTEQCNDSFDVTLQEVGVETSD